VLDDKRVVTVEGRVEIRDDPNQPGATRAIGLEGRWGRTLVSRTERTRKGGVGLHD
jgi:hypothetical protein